MKSVTEQLHRAQQDNNYLCLAVAIMAWLCILILPGRMSQTVKVVDNLVMREEVQLSINRMDLEINKQQNRAIDLLTERCFFEGGDI